MKMEIKSNIISKEQYFSNLLTIFGFVLLIYGGLQVLLKSYLLCVTLTLLIIIIFFLFFNKRLFFKIEIKDDYKVWLFFPFNFLGKKQQIIKVEDINKIIYYGGSYSVEPHCTLIYNNQKIKFNCSLKEAKKIEDFVRKKGVEFIFNDDIKASFRK